MALATTSPERPARSRVLLWATFAAMILGVTTGWILDEAGLSVAAKSDITQSLGIVTNLFLRLIRMIVAPLIFSTLVVGIAQMDSASSVGKVSLRALIWFIAASLIAIAIGLITANILEPGVGMNLHVTANAASALQPAPPLDVPKMIEEFVPTSIVDAMAENRVLQIVVFAVFAGIAVGSLGQRAELVRTFAEQVSTMMAKIAGYVMSTAPLAVFSALTSTTLEHGIGTIAILGRFVLEFYVALFLMGGVMIAVAIAFLGRRIVPLLKIVREPLLIAFSTSSSEASYPSAFAALQQFGVSRRVAGLVLPLGYAFNLDGLLVYASFCVIFIAQAYGIHLGWQTQIGIMLFLLVANKGAAGVPRGGLINLTVALTMFNLPVAGVALILGIDAVMDMGRTAINVLGNTIATASIAQMEGELLSEAELAEAGNQRDADISAA